MPLRITCPACSAGLNMKDELAGRAVKCPRCGGVIPASATKAPPPAPAFEVVEDDTPPAPPKTTKPKAAPKRPVVVLDDGDDGDEEDDRSAQRRAANRSEKAARGKRNERVLTGMVAYWLVAVALSAWLSLRDTDTSDSSGAGPADTAAAQKPSLDVPGPATAENYQKIKLTETRGELETMFGPAETPIRNEFALAFSSTSISYRTWLPMVDKGRVLMWRNNKDRLCVCLSPGGRAQAKLFETPTPGSAVSEGKLVD